MEKLNQKFSDYSDYFEEIRKRVFSLVLVFIIFFIAGFFQAGNILKIIINVFKLQDVSIVTTSPFQFLDLATKIGMYSGILFCLPLLIYHAYDFLKDGLTKKEKKLFFILLPMSFALFIFGFSYSFTILYFYLNTISVVNLAFGIKNIWDISSFMSQIIIASTFLGLLFQFPIILTFLIRIRIVSVKYLRDKRVYAIACMFIFVGFLPPPEILSTLFQVSPLILLYQLTIWVNSSFATKRQHAIEDIAQSADIIKTAT